MMEKEQIRTLIETNLASNNISDASLRIQPDSYRGWRIAIITSSFEGHSYQDRRKLALDGIERLTNVEVAWLDLLTPDEQEWAGALPSPGATENAPLWPESLARARTTSPGTHYPSDLEEDLERPFVATFYSLRGGVGRSTALSYTGRLLAEKGYSVICVDMDLEAPGLAALFGVEAQVSEDQGVVPLLVSIDTGGEPNITDHLVRIDLDIELYLLPAGNPTPDYARRLSLIDPEAWYSEERNPLRILIEQLGSTLPFRPDVLLLDARTGINPMSGPLLFDLADLAIVVFFPHPQAKAGTEALVRGLLRSNTRRPLDPRLTPEPRFIVSPLPASRAREVISRYEERALSWINHWMLDVNEARSETETEPFIETDITHFIRYREDLATSDRVSRDEEIDLAFTPVANWILRFIPTAAETGRQATIESIKPKILGELRFPTGTAEDQEDIVKSFVTTPVVRRALSEEVPLVVGRKGTGKTAIFRRLVERAERGAAPVHAPAQLGSSRSWMLTADGFRSAESALQESGLSWNQLWSYQACIAALYYCSRQGLELPEALPFELPPETASSKDVLNSFRTATRSSDLGLELTDLLRRLDRGLDHTVLLVFDGLDSGFGHTSDDRKRRQAAVEGLFALWVDQAGAFENLRFKVLLREDIWKDLRFENKSHLYGRSVALRWNDRSDYFKVILKQAARSNAFASALPGLLGRDQSRNDYEVDLWNDEDVQKAWSFLVGERMKGGKTTFTRNWVWNRLADANNDHTPRYLLQLFNEAARRELEESKASAYTRSIIRPRALERSLPIVSAQAFEGLAEEFKELEPIFDRLRKHGATPVPASELDQLEDELSLAREVGVLSEHEGSDENIRKYRVPEIYRHALEMKRRGPL